MTDIKISGVNSTSGQYVSITNADTANLPGALQVGTFAAVHTLIAGDFGGGNGTNEFFLSPTAGTSTSAFLTIGDPTGKRFEYDQGTGSNGQVKLRNSTNNTPVRIHGSGFARFGRGASTGAEGDLYLGQDGTDGGTATGQYEFAASTSQGKYKNTSGTTQVRLDGINGYIRVGNPTLATSLGDLSAGDATNSMLWDASLSVLEFSSGTNVQALNTLNLYAINPTSGLQIKSSGTGTPSIRLWTGTSGVERFQITEDGAFEGFGIATASAPANPAASKGRYFYDSTLNKWQLANASSSYTSLFGICKQANISAQTTNATIVTYTTDAVDNDYEVSAQLNVTVATTLSTTLLCAYTDVSGTSRTMILPVCRSGGDFIAAGVITTAVPDQWHTSVIHIRAQASTAITISTTAGTFTGVTYSASGVIKKTS